MMTKFEDQLFADLMTEHRTALDGLPHLPAWRVQPRAAWLTGAATAGVGAAAAAGVMLAGGGSPAYAVTQHPNGTVTLSVASKAGIGPANTQLHVLGDPVVVVPVGAGCPSISSLPTVQPTPGDPMSGSVSASGTAGSGSASSTNSITIDLQGVPAGATAIVAYTTLADGQVNLATAVITGAVPSCVSLPAPPAHPGPGSGHSSGGPGLSSGSNGGPATSTGPGGNG
jgi:hypothetical protein